MQYRVSDCSMHASQRGPVASTPHPHMAGSKRCQKERNNSIQLFIGAQSENLDEGADGGCLLVSGTGKRLFEDMHDARYSSKIPAEISPAFRLASIYP